MQNGTSIKIIECPRDAMQGIKSIIPARLKANYINQLMKVGFDTLDCLSFVSPKAIPQMADSHEVASMIEKNGSLTRVLAIVLNKRGAEDAVQHDVVDYLGFPFGISETFQQRNGNSTIAENWERLMEVLEVCQAKNKTPVVYLSMGFGNPYGDDYSPQMVQEWIGNMQNAGIAIVSIADTVGVALPQAVHDTTAAAIHSFPDLEIGVHLHGTDYDRPAKVEAAFQAGCRRFDGAMGGYGGCPMAGDDLVGNVNTGKLIEYFKDRVQLSLNEEALSEAKLMCTQIFRNQTRS